MSARRLSPVIHCVMLPLLSVAEIAVFHFIRSLSLLFCAVSFPVIAADYGAMTEKKLLKLAEQGDVQAINQLGRPFLRYSGAKRESRAIEVRLPWLRKAADADNADAQRALALLLMQPPAGMAPDYEAASHYLERSIAYGKKVRAGCSSCEWAQYYVDAGMLQTRLQVLLAGPPAESDDGVAELKYAQQAMKPHNFGTGHDWGETLVIGDAERYREWLNKAADKKNHNAMWALVQLDGEYKNPPPPSMEKAGLACEKRALARLMDRYRAGVQLEEAMRWRIVAGDCGDAGAAFQIAELYQTHKKDPQKSREWFQKAAALGHEKARHIVMQDADPTLAKLMSKAGGNDAEALFAVGDYIQNGNWPGRNPQMAGSWYYRASLHKHAEATWRLALLTEHPKDRADRVRTAAALGHAAAQAEWQKLSVEIEQQQKATQAAALAAARVEFMARIDRDGSTDKFEVEQYCAYGGRNCQALRGLAHQTELQQNRAAEAANMQRIQNLYGDQRSQDERDREARARSECMKRKTDSINRQTYGEQDWRYAGEC